MGDVAQFVGAVVGAAVLTWIWYSLLSRLGHHPARVLAASLLSLVTATAIAGLGFSTDGQPDFARAFAVYSVPQLLILGLLLWKQSRQSMGGTPEPHATVPHRVDELAEAAVRGALADKDGETRPDPNQTAMPTKEYLDEPFELAPPPTDPRPIAGNLITKHWRGGYSLGVSYWLINVVANVALVVLVAILVAIFTPRQGFEPVPIFALTLSLWATVAIILVWQIVGVWRSAERYADERRKLKKGTFWAKAAQVMVVLGVLQNLGAFNATGRPQLIELYRIAFLNDPDIPANELELSSDGLRLKITGGIKYGLARDIDTVLRAAPSVVAITLTSPGGRIAEAAKIFDIVRDRQLDTVVAAECASACTIIFAAGRNRFVLDEALLGFHGSYFPGMTKAELDDANAEIASLYRAAGFDGLFVGKALSIPPEQMWYPTKSELLRAQVITANWADDFVPVGELSPSPAASAPSVPEIPSLVAIEQDLRAASGVVDALHQVEPGTAQRLYERVRLSYEQGSDQAALTEEVRAITAEAIGRHYPHAADDVLIELSKLLADQAAFLLEKDPRLCFFFTTAGNGYDLAVAELPDALLAREIELSERVLRSSKPRLFADQDRLDAIYSEVFAGMQRTLTTYQFELFTTAPEAIQPKDYGQYCISAIMFYREAANLAPSAAGDLMRDVFSQ